MAVEVVYRSSRDVERLFMDKAEADRHDKMLELAETLAEVLQENGYTTIGVTANPVINSVFNMHQGFDAYSDSDVLFSWMKETAGSHDKIKLAGENIIFSRK